MSQSDEIKKWLVSRKDDPPSVDEAIEKYPKTNPEVVKYHYRDAFPEEYAEYNQEEKEKASVSKESAKAVEQYIYNNKTADIGEVKENFPDISEDLILETYSRISDKRYKTQIGYIVEDMILRNPEIDYKEVSKRFPDYAPGSFRSKKLRTLKAIQDGRMDDKIRAIELEKDSKEFREQSEHRIDDPENEDYTIEDMEDLPDDADELSDRLGVPAEEFEGLDSVNDEEEIEIEEMDEEDEILAEIEGESKEEQADESTDQVDEICQAIDKLKDLLEIVQKTDLKPKVEINISIKI